MALQDSLFKLGDTAIANSTEFKYLGVMISNTDSNKMIEHRIASATGKFHEMKKVFTDHRIRIITRADLLTSFVRSRLMYNCATWEFGSFKIRKLEVEWIRCLRRLVKGGFRRKNSPPKGMTPEEIKQGKWDYAYVYTNQDIYRITGCEPLWEYQEKQHLQWLAHVIRMPNSTLQKQTLFLSQRPGKPCRWKRLERRFGLDAIQIRSTMRNKTSFNRWMNSVY